MKRICNIAALVLSAASAFVADAAETTVVRPIDAAVTLDIGGVKNLDTYLSPIEYKGKHISVGFELMRAMKCKPEKMVSATTASLNYDNTANPSGNNTMHTLLADVDWAAMRRWNDVLLPGLDMFAGGRFGFEGGVTYNPRNSNNVCSPQIYANLGITAMAAYRFKIGKLPVTARYRPSIPVVGCFYLPDYDQTFYEIYLGNYGETANFSWWANRFDMENLITTDLHFGSAALRIGYRNEFTTIWENNISVRRCVHSLVVGVAWKSIRINPAKGLPEKAKLINALY